VVLQLNEDDSKNSKGYERKIGESSNKRKKWSRKVKRKDRKRECECVRERQREEQIK
jgi:hypothetical protein